MSAIGPELTGERYVDADQCRGERMNTAPEQTEAGVM